MNSNESRDGEPRLRLIHSDVVDMLSLADFPLGSDNRRSLVGYRTSTKRLHLDRECRSIARATRVMEERIELPDEATLADVQDIDAHCVPSTLAPYMLAATAACSTAAQLPDIARRLGVRLPLRRDAIPGIDVASRSVDWPAIEELADLRCLLAYRRDQDGGYERTPMSSEHLLLFEAAIEELDNDIRYLWEVALELARSQDGRESLSRMIAAACIRRGRLPRQYARIYQEFRQAIAEALESFARNGKDEAIVAEVLADRSFFDLALRWVEALEQSGSPTRTTEILTDEIPRWRSLNPPGRMASSIRAIELAGQSALAFLDGLRARGDEPVMVLAAAYESPFTYHTRMRDLQWEVYPSATAYMRRDGQDDGDEEVRVAVVPRLWTEALVDADRPSMGGDFIILAHDLGGRVYDSDLCAAVAEAVVKVCDAEMLRCRRWYPTVAIRVRYERIEREAAEQVLVKRTW